MPDPDAPEGYRFPEFAVSEICKELEIEYWEFILKIYPRMASWNRGFESHVERYVKTNGHYPPEETYYKMHYSYWKHLNRYAFGYAEWKHKYCVIPWEAKQDMDMIRMGQLMQAVVRKANHAINLREELPSGAPLPEIAGDMSRTRKKLLYGSAEASEEEENKDSENESGEENADQN